MWRQILSLKMTKLDLSNVLLSAYSQVSNNKINAFFVGTKDLAATELEAANNTLADLEKLSLIFHPAPLDFRKVPQVRELLKQLRQGDLTEELIRKAIRNKPDLASAGDSIPQLKAKYELDIDFKNSIDELLQSAQSIAL